MLRLYSGIALKKSNGIDQSIFCTPMIILHVVNLAFQFPSTAIRRVKLKYGVNVQQSLTQLRWYNHSLAKGELHVQQWIVRTQYESLIIHKDRVDIIALVEILVAASRVRQVCSRRCRNRIIW